MAFHDVSYQVWIVIRDGQPIQNYQPALHHVTINESLGVDICQDCVDKIIKWQGSIYAQLFPTKAMKKRFGQK